MQGYMAALFFVNMLIAIILLQRIVITVGPSVSVQQFIELLNEMNRYLLYFPEELPTQLDQEEIIEILHQSKYPEWHAAMISANIDIFEMISCITRRSK
jgi:hypothetical protein